MTATKKRKNASGSKKSAKKETQSSGVVQYALALKAQSRSPVTFKVMLPVVVLLALLLSIPLLQSSMHQFFDRYPVRSVKVYGAFNYLNAEKLEKALEKSLVANYFEVELIKIKIAAEALPWVEKAWVKKSWPDTVVIKISERVAVANWGEDQLISHNNEIFRSEDFPHIPSLPSFLGVEEHAPYMMDRFKQLTKIFQPADLAMMQLKLEERLSWRIVLSDGLELIVDEKDCLNKVERFVSLYLKMPEHDRGFIERVDLRYDNGLAIKWKKKNVESNAA